MSSCTAIIPYIPPVAPEEFIRKGVEKARANSSVSKHSVSLTHQLTLSMLSRLRMNVRPILTSEELVSCIDTLEAMPFLFQRTTRVAPIAKLNGDEIAEALISELAITTADDARPIVATYGCGPCVAVGGYDSTNKIAFVVHFPTADVVIKSGGLIFYNISKLVKTPISSPIQLHLRGGREGRSEATVKAIKVWMTWWEKDGLPMEVASEDILISRQEMRSKSLSIDSRTGEVSEYNPLANAKSREFSELDEKMAISGVRESEITLAYAPK